MIWCWVTLIFFAFQIDVSYLINVDPNGYIVYCPCMGRFGNQADHFLGSLSFAHSINRTLILPPWVEYHSGRPKSVQVPFDRYFRVDKLLEFHRVITMERFMQELAPTLWPPEKRKVFCYSTRHGTKENDCNAKDGNPFGPFWDTFDIDFVESIFYGNRLSYDAGQRWNKIYPPDMYPVLAFAGAPAHFPVRQTDVYLHKYLHWSEQIMTKAEHFINNELPAGPFIGIHLRNDLDWDNVCVHVKENNRNGHLFASAQCLGYDFENGPLTMEICKPSLETIIRQTRRAVKKYGAKSVFVGADKNHLINELNKGLKKLDVKAYRREPDVPHITLAILAQAEHFIGNCVSTFSAFVKRERDAKSLSSDFWGTKTSDSTMKAQRQPNVEL